MENNRPNIEQIKKHERSEKIVVFSLLVISLAVAFFSFINKGNISASILDTTNTSKIEQSEETKENSFNDSEAIGSSRNAESDNSQSNSDHMDHKTIIENTIKEGIYAVGLFSSSENALNVKLSLDSLGFNGAVKTREDGKLVVGVEADRSDTVIMKRVKEIYLDAIFIKN